MEPGFLKADSSSKLPSVWFEQHDADTTTSNVKRADVYKQYHVCAGVHWALIVAGSVPIDF